MTAQFLADTILAIHHQHQQNTTLKSNINYMSSLMYETKPYQPKAGRFQFESVEISYLLQSLADLIKEEVELTKEHFALEQIFDEEDYK